MGDQGLASAPGPLAESSKRFGPLFDPLAAASRAPQNKAALRPAAETGWRGQEYRRNDRARRAWLWISGSEDALSCHIAPARRAKGAKRLFGDTACAGYGVCARSSADRKLGPRPRRQGHPVLVPGPPEARLRPERGRPCPALGLEQGRGRAERGYLPAEPGAAGTVPPRARPRTPDAGLRRGAGCPEDGGRAPVRGRRSRAARPVGRVAQGQAAAQTAQASPGAVRLPRQALRSHGHQGRGARTARRGPPAPGELRFEQRRRREVHRDQAFGGGHALEARPRCPALAGGVAGGVREEGRQAAGRPRAPGR